MRRPFLIWPTFFLFVALGLGAMAWMTRTVLRLDQAQLRATAAAQVEENVRLALWRMDYAIAPLLSQETARPYFEYSSVFPAERAYTRMFTELKSGDVLVPSPLLRSASPYVLLYFQLDPDGKVTSPQAPGGNVRKIAEERYTSADEITRAQQRLAQVEKLLQNRALLSSLPPPRDAEIWANNKLRVVSNGPGGAGGRGGGSGANSLNVRENRSLPNSAEQVNEAYNAPASRYDVQQQAAIQQLRGQQEYAARQQTNFEYNDILVGNSAGPYASTGVSFSVMQPLWSGDTLLLARQVSINGRRYVQGCLLDWPAIRKWLLDSASDLIPHADLVPARSATDDKQPRMLASIPARLVLSPSSILGFLLCHSVACS